MFGHRDIIQNVKSSSGILINAQRIIDLSWLHCVIHYQDLQNVNIILPFDKEGNKTCNL